MSDSGTWKNYFDDFFFFARVLPAVTLMLPVLIIALYKGILKEQWEKAGTAFALSIVFITFIAYILRERGKKYEKKMCAKLGGMPTTIIMRFTDDRIDFVSKSKYHRWFNEREDAFCLPMTLEEERADKYSDSKYQDAMNYLRVRANADREKFFRVYQELKKYNYWRNLYGCKDIAMLLYGFLIFREILLIEKFSIVEMIVNPLPKYAAICIFFFWSVLYCAIVTQKTVEKNAFDYAIALVETIHNL